MKKRIIVFISFFLALLFSCSGKKVENKTQLNSYIEGTIQTVGNEPFTNLALQVNDSTIYLLECTNELSDSLQKNHGELYKIYFSKKIETELGTRIKVSKAEHIRKQ